MAEVKALLEGYRRFYDRHFLRNDTLFSQLATGQSPKTLVIACSDSRVDPALIMDADPGDIFVVRNVANMVPPYEMEKNGGYHGTSAALEFAVRHLNIKHIIVFGHSGCAGIRALLHSTPEQEQFTFIHPWVNIAAKAKEYTQHLCGDVHHPDATETCELQAILISLQNLRSFPWINQKVEEGGIRLHGWYFRLATGQLQTWDSAENRFSVVPTDFEKRIP